MTGDDRDGRRDLPDPLADPAAFEAELAGRRPVVFLDYDGVLTPIVERPEDAVISDSMRQVVRELAQRCTVCVVSGRDRPVVQELMGIEDLVVAGSHGFDIWSPEQGTLEHDAASGFEELLDGVKTRLTDEVAPIDGADVEPKRASVAVHYRRVAEDEKPRIRSTVEAILAEHPDDLKVTPGKMVFELQPKLDWDKGKAVLHLIDALDLGSDDLVPLYLGDDVTDEDAFAALADRGIGIFVGDAEDLEGADRPTAARYILHSIDDVETFLKGLAR